MDKICKIHGLTRHKEMSAGTGAKRRIRCLACVAVRQARSRAKKKSILVEEAGGRCVLCGYKKCVMALEFHHKDPSKKAFEIGLGVRRLSLNTCRSEAKKCVLVCSNCHAEVEFGVPDTLEALQKHLAP